jgi:hypothetical protein
MFEMDEAGLASLNALRVVAEEGGGYPCRVSLRDAEPGEQLILVNHVSQPLASPFRACHAIYVRKDAERLAPLVDAVSDYLDRRTLSLRGFDASGRIAAALLAAPGGADAAIRELLSNGEVAEIHAHSAAYGCFLARIERN